MLSEKFNPRECDRMSLSTFRSSRENPRRLNRSLWPFFLGRVRRAELGRHELRCFTAFPARSRPRCNRDRLLGLSGVCGENVESRSTVGLAADWSIGEDQRRSRFDQRTNVLQKGWNNRMMVPSFRSIYELHFAGFPAGSWDQSRSAIAISCRLRL